MESRKRIFRTDIANGQLRFNVHQYGPRVRSLSPANGYKRERHWAGRRSYTLRDNSERPCKLESVHNHTATRTNRLIAVFMCVAIT